MARRTPKGRGRGRRKGRGGNGACGKKRLYNGNGPNRNKR